MNTHFLGHAVGEPSFVPPASAWLRHGPFVQWLVRAARPRRIVELGTHYGYSYFAMCEAVAAAELRTECFAVDTWLGDEHAGLYGEEVFDLVREVNSHYAFSTLLRKTFFEALDDIEDGSVDLLHVDGRHFYEDVKEDFESWIPKLSTRAIVLFHDTEVRDRGFGVYRYWDELVRQFPAVNFTYQHGLGVLFFGENFTDEIAALIELLGGDAGREMITSFFTLAGDRFLLERQIAAAKAQTASLGAGALLSGASAMLPREIQSLPDQLLSAFASREAAYAKQLHAKEEERAKLENAKNAEICRLTANVTEAAGAIKLKDAEIKRLSEKVKAQLVELQIRDHNIVALVGGLRRAQKLIQRPFQTSVRRNLAKIALKRIPALSESQIASLNDSVAKREYRTMFGLLDRRGRFRLSRDIPGLGALSDIAPVPLADVPPAAASAVPMPITKPSDPKFSPEASDTWKRELLGSSFRSRLLAERPLVSIIMPTKNRLSRLEASIGSVLAQSYDNWELIIIDDGSEDGTFEAVPSRWPDQRIRIVSADGSGVCAARNTGLAAARGEIFAYLDDDNRWRADYLEITLLEMLRSGAACCYSALLRLRDGFDNPEAANTLCVAFDLERLKLTNYIDLNIFAHRREVFEKLGGFDTSLRRMVDWDLIIRYCEVFTPTYCNSVGADYDNSRSPDRISIKEKISYQFVVRNKHMIDWDAMRRDACARDLDLVSIIICVYNNPDLTDKCLSSIFGNEAGLPFEVILVDNKSDDQTVELLYSWAERESRIKLVLNKENMNFSLGNNLGFAASRGARVVFLNNDTEVTPEWLSALLQPMTVDAAIRGVQPQLIYPDGKVQCLGLVFSDHSPFAYGLYTGRPGDDPLSSPRRRFKALTAACLALHAQDFANAQGFDPIFVNGQEDVDLCLRIGEGNAVFTCATDSVVIHHEGKSEGRGRAIPANRAIFAERWGGKVAGDDQIHYVEDGVIAEEYMPNAQHLVAEGLAIQIPKLIYPSPAAQCVSPAIIGGITGFRLRIPCPRPALKDRWGDYHFAVALAKAAARIGLSARIDFLESWADPAAFGEADLVLRGLSVFPERTSDTAPLAGRAPRLMWMISHPDKVEDPEIDGYDHLFVASDHWSKQLIQRGLGTSISTLLQCTEVERFNINARVGAPHHSRLYVGNSRKVMRSTVAKAIAENLPLDLYGEMWEGLAPAGWILGENVPNVRLPSYYAGADVVLNDHWDAMRSYGFASNRIFDVLATGAPLLTDSVAALPEEISAACTILDDGASLSCGIEIARGRHTRAERDEIAAWVAANHSFSARLRRICAILS
ncbi:glycosyltransferase [Frigidibacter sp. MR17.14]|uniref:glycosyltransferase n=1 Tax=Frigidibacter sp. MR17.14 TaxID=3126509 RepID=UPI003012C32C